MNCIDFGLHENTRTYSWDNQVDFSWNRFTFVSCRLWVISLHKKVNWNSCVTYNRLKQRCELVNFCQWLNHFLLLKQKTYFAVPSVQTDWSNYVMIIASVIVVHEKLCNVPILFVFSIGVGNYCLAVIACIHFLFNCLTWGEAI